jgi:hypothetical protein
MTLNTTGIRRYGEQLYRRLAAENFLNADSCADAYEMFVDRMRRYRQRHPETERVSPVFVKKCERWVRTDLLRRARARRVNEAAETELAKRILDVTEKNGRTGNTVLFRRLEGFLTHWTRAHPRAAGYARLFLLHHAWQLSPRRVRLFAPFVSGRKSDFVRDVRRVKKHVAARCAGRAAERMRAAQYWYAKGVRAELAAEECTGKKRAAALAARREYERRHRLALARLGKMQYRPAPGALAEIAGVSVERIRRALRVCEREMREYFR